MYTLQQFGSWKGLAMYGVQCWNPLSKGVTWRDWLLLSMDSIWKSTLIHQNVVLFCQKMFQINPGKNKCFFLTKFKFDQIRFLGYSLNIFFFIEMFWITVWVFTSRYWHENSFSKWCPLRIGEETGSQCFSSWFIDMCGSQSKCSNLH